MTDLYAWSSFVDRLWKPDCAAEGQDKQLRDGNAAFSTQRQAIASPEAIGEGRVGQGALFPGAICKRLLKTLLLTCKGFSSLRNLTVGVQVGSLVRVKNQHCTATRTDSTRE